MDILLDIGYTKNDKYYILVEELKNKIFVIKYEKQT
jgi:hypothetical protein